METLLFALESGLLDDQFLLGVEVGVLVDQFVEVGVGQPVELPLQGQHLALEGVNVGVERGRFVGDFLVDGSANGNRLIPGDGQRNQFFQTLVLDAVLLNIGLLARAALPGAAAIAIQAAVTLAPLSGNHRSAGTAKDAAEGKSVVLAIFAWLLPPLQRSLYAFEYLGRDEGLVFSFEHLALPLHHSHIQAVGEDVACCTV